MAIFNSKLLVYQRVSRYCRCFEKLTSRRPDFRTWYAETLNPAATSLVFWWHPVGMNPPWIYLSIKAAIEFRMFSFAQKDLRLLPSGNVTVCCHEHGPSYFLSGDCYPRFLYTRGYFKKLCRLGIPSDSLPSRLLWFWSPQGSITIRWTRHIDMGHSLLSWCT